MGAWWAAGGAVAASWGCQLGHEWGCAGVGGRYTDYSIACVPNREPATPRMSVSTIGMPTVHGLLAAVPCGMRCSLFRLPRRRPPPAVPRAAATVHLKTR